MYKAFEYYLRLTVARFSPLLLVGLLLTGAIYPIIAEYGLDQPQPIGKYLNNIFPEETPGGVSGGWEVVNAFPNLTFVDPVQIIELPGQNKFLVAGKKGSLWTFDNNPNVVTKQVFLNVEPVVRTGGDTGLLGVVLHPEYGQPGSPNRGYLYVFYRYTLDQSRQEAYMRLSRFTVPDGAAVADRNSEYVLIQQYDRHDWHNGGGMFFGPDGFLYLTIGDEGGANDQFNSTQKLNDGLFSGVLRIDVDQRGGSISHPIRRQPQNPAVPPAGWPNSFTQGYFIPNDNPWQDPNGGILEEFYAIGLRSPHRMTYDAVTGNIWVGDVGQGSREEISVIAKGDNLQWPYKEGYINGAKTRPTNLIGTDTPPVYDYPRGTGTCVIGGFVYRGAKWRSQLNGKYIFGDHTVRNIWIMDYDPISGTTDVDFMVNVPAEGVGGKAGISSFGTDSEGNIYVLKLFGTNQDGGKVYKIQPRGLSSEPPQLLSQTGAFSDLATLTPASGIIPYTVNAKLWSDGAVKKRWIALPNDGAHDTPAEKITFNAHDSWDFPEGTVIIKHFDLPLDKRNPTLTKRLETRFIVYKKGGGIYGITYRWNEAGTEATLLSTGETASVNVVQADGSSQSQIWEFPSREQCLTCHNSNAGHTLGIQTHQLNGDLTYPATGRTANQLKTWGHLGLFDNTYDENAVPSYPKSVSIDDASASLELRVRAYIDANCAHCHRPNGVNAHFDARFSQALPFQNLIYGKLEAQGGDPENVVIKPQDVARSMFHTRDNSLGTDKMPPLAKNLVDETYMQVLRDWINSLDPNDPMLPEEGDMIAWWKLNADAEDYIADADGAFQGGATLVADPDKGSVASFDQDGKWVRVEPQPQLAVGQNNADFALTFWMKLLEGPNGQWRSLIHKGNGANERTFAMWLQPDNNRVHFRISTTAGWNEGGDSKADLPLNQWTHVAYVKYQDELRLYFNGELDQSAPLNGPVVANSGPLYLGDTPWNPGVKSRMSDVRLYGRALAPAEVRSLFDATSGQPQAIFAVSPAVGRAPLEVALDATASFVPAGRSASFAWVLGDGSRATGATFTHTYTSPGMYPVKLVLTDNEGQKDSLVQVVEVKAADACLATGELQYETWTGITGTTISSLTSAPTYPANPSQQTLIRSLFEGPVDVADNYGSRISGILCAPESGAFTFWISGDDNAELWLSTDADPSHAVRIAHVPGWSSPREWTKYPEQQSAPVVLEKDKKYYLFALHKEGGGGDNFSVGWQLPSGLTERPMPASYFSLPGFQEDNCNWVQSAVEGERLNFTGTRLVRFGANGSFSYGTFSGGVDCNTSTFGNPAPGAAKACWLCSENVLPIADFSFSPASGYAPLTVSFDGRASADSDGTLVSYAWDFKDGQTGMGPQANHTFTTPGNYAVRLTVTDNLGGTAYLEKTVTVSPKVSQILDFAAIPDKFTSDPPFQLQASASSGLPVSFEVLSGPATATGSVLTLTGTTGTVTVKARQAGNYQYEAVEATQSFEVSRQAQSLTFAALADKATTDPPFGLTATASSGLPVQFEVISGPATVLGNVLTLTGEVGQVFVRASQAGNDEFLPAAPITRNFAVGKTSQVITFDPIPDAYTTDPPMVLSPTASSGLPVGLTLISGPASLSGNTLTWTGEDGTVVLEATQPGDGQYSPAVPLRRSFEVFVADAACDIPANLALGKVATQSSTYGEGLASRAVDGVTDGSGGPWAGGTITHTLEAPENWWELDLGALADIQQLTLFNRTDCCGDRLSDFYVLVSDIPFVSSTLSGARNQPGVDAYHFPGAAAATENLTIGRSGRYVRVQLAGTNYLSLAEVMVMGCWIEDLCSQPPALTLDTQDPETCGAPGLAIFSYTRGVLQVLDASGTDVTGQLPALAAGTYNYSLREGKCVNSGTFTLLDPPRPVVTIDPLGPLSLDAGLQTLMAQPAGGQWLGAATPAGTFDPAQGPGIYEVIYSVSNAQGCVAADTLSIEVLDPTSCLNPTNLALGKPARQSSTYYGEVAGKAVDGNANGNLEAANSVTHTQYDLNGWWEVDLQTLADLESIRIFNRTDCCGDRLDDFYVLVSPVPFISQDLTASLNQPGVSASLVQGPAGISASIAMDDTRGRYVRIQLAGQNFLSLAEVEVMGCVATSNCTDPPVVVVSPADAPACGGTGSVQINYNKGVLTVLNSDNNPVTAQLNALPAGEYTYSVVEGECLENGSFTISEPPVPVVTIDPAGPFTTADGPVQLTANPTGGVWSGSVSPSGLFEPAGGDGRRQVIYTYTGVDNCAASDTLEIRVVDPNSGCLTPVNLARTGTATQSSQYGDGQAGIANDGNTDGSLGPWGANASITHTLFDNEAWWELDLGEIADLEEIRVYNRTDCCQERLSNFYVLVSNLPFVSKDLTATLAQPGVDAYLVPGTAAGPTTLAIERSGRYVRIQLQEENHLSLAEVEVMGCASATPAHRFTGPNESTALEPETRVRILSNPFDEFVVLEVAGSEDARVDLRVLTLLGQEIFQAAQVPVGQLRIDSRSWASGVYLLQSHGKGHVQTLRMLKK